MKKIKRMYEINGLIAGTNTTICTHVRAADTNEARKIMMERVPELIIHSIHPIGD